MRSVAGSVLVIAGTIAGVAAAFLHEYRPPRLIGEGPKLSVLLLAAMAILEIVVGIRLLTTASREREKKRLGHQLPE